MEINIEEIPLHDFEYWKKEYVKTTNLLDKAIKEFTAGNMTKNGFLMTYGMHEFAVLHYVRLLELKCGVVNG